MNKYFTRCLILCLAFFGLLHHNLRAACYGNGVSYPLPNFWGSQLIQSLGAGAGAFSPDGSSFVLVTSGNSGTSLTTYSVLPCGALAGGRSYLVPGSAGDPVLFSPNGKSVGMVTNLNNANAAFNLYNVNADGTLGPSTVYSLPNAVFMSFFQDVNNDPWFMWISTTEMGYYRVDANGNLYVPIPPYVFSLNQSLSGQFYLSPNGGYLVNVTAPNTVTIYQIGPQVPINNGTSYTIPGLSSFVFSPDSAYLFAMFLNNGQSPSNSAAAIYPVETGGTLGSPTYYPPPMINGKYVGYPFWASFSSDGTNILVANFDGIHTTTFLSYPFSNGTLSTNNVTSFPGAAPLASSPNNAFVVGNGISNVILYVLSCPTPPPQNTCCLSGPTFSSWPSPISSQSSQSQLNQIALSPNNTQLAVSLGDNGAGTFNGMILFDISAAGVGANTQYPISISENAPANIIFSADGTKLFASGSALPSANVISIYDIKNGALSLSGSSYPLPANCIVWGNLATSPDGQYLAAGTNGKGNPNGYGFLVSAGTTLLGNYGGYDEVSGDYPTGVYVQVVAADSQLFASILSLHYGSNPTGHGVQLLQPVSPALGVDIISSDFELPNSNTFSSAISKNGYFLATMNDGGIIIYNLVSGAYGSDVLNGTYPLPTNTAVTGKIGAFSPDGSCLTVIETEPSNQITVYPVNACGVLGNPVSYPLTAQAVPNSLTFSSDGSFLVGANNNGISLFNVASCPVVSGSGSGSGSGSSATGEASTLLNNKLTIIMLVLKSLQSLLYGQQPH